jgi:hypothetical protein
MPSNDPYALMAGAAYASTRAVDNQIPAPEDWYRVDQRIDDTSGFEAYAFGNAPTLAASTEIVIAYAGTNPNSLLDPDWLANAGLATGTGSDQLVRASRFYLDIQGGTSSSTTITLTGHSLGGGLAALVGVYFDVEAHTFDQAPFARSAQDSALFPSSVAQDLRDDLTAQVDQNGNPVYSPEDLAALDQYLALRDANGGIPAKRSGKLATAA